jgi:hypothetical protein
MTRRSSSAPSTSSASAATTLRKLPLHARKDALERLLARRPEGDFVNPFERGDIGPDLLRAACRMGWRGWSPSTGAGRIGRSVEALDQGQEPKHPALERVME